jgi:hypothetical protein
MTGGRYRSTLPVNTNFHEYIPLQFIRPDTNRINSSSTLCSNATIRATPLNPLGNLLDSPVLQSIRPLFPAAYRKHISRISKESTAPLALPDSCPPSISYHSANVQFYPFSKHSILGAELQGCVENCRSESGSCRSDCSTFKTSKKLH